MAKPLLLRTSVFLFLLSPCSAQPPMPRREPPLASSPDRFVADMMSFDQNGDGKLARGEITDGRLLRLFDRADRDKDGVVTREELTSVYAEEVSLYSSPGGDRGGPGPRGGPEMRFKPGEILPPFLKSNLHLTAQQESALAKLQHEVDTKLDHLLTPEQKRQLKAPVPRGPAPPPMPDRGFFPRPPGQP